MKMSDGTSLSKVVLCLLASIATVRSHTWVEQMSVIDSNGTFTGAPGYARGNVLRTSSGFNDGTMTNLIPPNGRSTGNEILATDPMCKSSQTVGNQTPGSPALSASPGDMIALRYQENGHVTLPQNQPGKPANRGTIYIYGTSKASNNDKFLSIHNVWNEAGTGGDGRGVLLATRNFDDGQCYQVNGGTISQTRQKQFPHTASPLTGADLWCQSDVILPSDLATSGSYTLYWGWEWPTAPSTSQPAGLNETYTTCMDVNLTPGSGTSKGLNIAQGQDLNSAAIATELSTAFIVQPTASRAVGSAPATSQASPTSVVATSPAIVGPTSAYHSGAANPASTATTSSPAILTQGFHTVTITEPENAVTVTVTETRAGVSVPSPATSKSQTSPLVTIATIAPSPVAVPSSPSGQLLTVSGTTINIQPFYTDAPGPSSTAVNSPKPTPTQSQSSVFTSDPLQIVTINTTVDVTDVITATASVPKIRGRSPKPTDT